MLLQAMDLDVEGVAVRWLYESTRVDEVLIEWPDGTREERGGLEVDRYHRIVAGE